MLTGNEVMEVLERGARMQETPYLIEVYRPLVEVFVSAVAGELSQPANFASLTRLSLVFMRLAKERDFLLKVVAAMPPGELNIPGRAKLLRELREEADEDISTLELMLIDPAATLAEIGESDDSVMLSEEIGLSDALRAAYQAGTLTLEQLLREQPGVIIIID